MAKCEITGGYPHCISSTFQLLVITSQLYIYYIILYYIILYILLIPFNYNPFPQHQKSYSNYTSILVR